MSDIRARLWRGWYRTRWRLRDRRQMSRTRVRRVAGVEVVVVPGVLDPAVFFSSEVLVDGLRATVRPGSTVLELGTGTGIGAIAASEAGASRVVATDIDPVAVGCARTNIERHGSMLAVDLRQGDLFDPVGSERFDVVAFNPPYLQRRAGGATAGLDRALYAPPELAERFASGLGEHVGSEGIALIVLSTNGDPDAWLAPLTERGYRATPIVSRDRGSETLTAWRISQIETHQPSR